MNFLAHLYLSGDSDELTLGNFIGDYVKGKQYLRYPPVVQRGILLHRRIDSFTDQHHIVKQSAERLRSHYGRYSGVVIDVFYDHFLSTQWNNYHNLPLPVFVRNAYSLILSKFFILPLQVRSFIPRIVASNRLLSYLQIGGVEKALSLMSKYSTLPNEATFAVETLQTYYLDYLAEFESFFDELRKYVIQYLSTE